MLAIDSASALGFRDTSISKIMDPDLPQISNGRNLLRPEDASRLGRPFRHDDADRPRASSENARTNGERGGALKDLDESPVPAEDDPEKAAGQIQGREQALLSLEDTTELFRKRVADARQDTEHALAGSEAVSDAVKPKLTLDLGHSNIARLPESVVDLIKAEVERLSLSHNQIWHIPLRFSECSHLRYLNIRSNVFREIPRGVYKLSQLEILDISRNKVRKISSDIRNLRSLRVFSVVHNRVEDLPPELYEMTKLQILKIAENPLRFKLKKIVEAKESEVSFSEMTVHERETAITLEIKRFLREANPVVAPIDVEASLQVEESPMETPKPLKRTLSSRFPVIPSTGTVDTGSEGNKSSPLQPYHPPPIPTRSHYRMASGTQSIALRRPGISPLINQTNSERNRSNSESVLQASAAARQKRMGMMRREKPDLDSIDELKANRNSHLRGFSHGSVLKRGVLTSPGGNSSSSPSSPRDPRRHRLAFVKRLSSLPEHKVETHWNNPVIDGAKGILYALYQIHPQISGLIAAIRGKDVRRSTLEFTFFNASTHVDRLNEALEQAELLDAEDEDAVEKIEAAVRQDCATCIMAYTHVTAQLQDNARRIVAGTDPRYVRTLMLLLYGSMLEVRNAIQGFGADVRVTQGLGHSRQTSSGSVRAIQTIPEEFRTPQQPVRTITPTRDRNLPSRQAGRLRSDTAIQHPAPDNIPGYQPNPVPPPNTGGHPTPIHLTGTTLNGGTSGTSTSFSNSGTLNSTASSGFRSRSGSRTATMGNSLASSVASTPRSGEGFSLPPSTPYATRVNPATGLTDTQEEAIFEQIYFALSRAYDAALHTVPIAKAQFLRCLEAAEENRQPKAVQELWSTLVYRCKLCIDVSEALQIRLVNMRVKDANVNGVAAVSGRNDPSLWLLCKNFLMGFIELLTEMRIAKSLRLLSQELITMLRPVQKASREAGRLIERSPWRYLTDSATATMPPPSGGFHSGQSMNGNNGYSNGINGVMGNGTMSPYPASGSSQSNHPILSPFPPPLVPVPPVPGSSSANGSGASFKQMGNGAGLPSNSAINGASPVSVPLPATPLSAALGPAAQATVPNTATIPSTPASAYGDQFFKGDVFQRADSLLSMPQVGTVNFLNRR